MVPIFPFNSLHKKKKGIEKMTSMKRVPVKPQTAGNGVENLIQLWNVCLCHACGFPDCLPVCVIFLNATIATLKKNKKLNAANVFIQV